MKINPFEVLTYAFIRVVLILKTFAFSFVIMNMVSWSLGDFIKSSSFRTIKTSNVSNTDMANAKMSRLKIVTITS